MQLLLGKPLASTTFMYDCHQMSHSITEVEGMEKESNSALIGVQKDVRE